MVIRNINEMLIKNKNKMKAKDGWPEENNE
jgi:hypothetical protein